ncbi:MAG: hypothetical protein HC905_22975, partial [Bacteroidales bacterium]|nr:hypothetical protein [Bacteroidales bacterium]
MKKKPIHVIIIAALFSIFFSIIFKWAHTGNPFRGETIMYATIIFINIIITGSIAFRIFRKYSNRPTYELQKNVIRNFILFVLIAFAISLFIVSLGIFCFYLIKGYSFHRFL